MTAVDELAFRAEILAIVAVPHVELIANDGKPHRVAAEEEQTVLDRMKADIDRNRGGPAPVPTGPVPRFRRLRRWLFLGVRCAHFACCGT